MDNMTPQMLRNQIQRDRRARRAAHATRRHPDSLRTEVLRAIVTVDDMLAGFEKVCAAAMTTTSAMRKLGV